MSLAPRAVRRRPEATAALAASYHGPVIKVSEDGYLTMFLSGRRVWETLGLHCPSVRRTNGASHARVKPCEDLPEPESLNRGVFSRHPPSLGHLIHATNGPYVQPKHHHSD